MLPISLTLCVLLMVLLTIMALISLNFSAYYHRNQNFERGDYAPKVGILMPLRGPDPYLKRCLLALTQQDYPDYTVHIVVDNEEDPARLIVEEVLAETNTRHITLDFLRDIPEKCALTCAAFLQGYDALPNDCEVIVMVDADSYPYPEWLSDLVAGLNEPGVGIVSGFRWYSPETPTLANLTRHVWNSGAIVQMLPMKIGWGGSLAFTKEAFEKGGVREQWESALCHDTLATNKILEAGFKFRLMPRVAMINEEDIDFRGCVAFIKRQLLFVRLYHKAFPLACVYGLTSALIHFASIVMLIAMFATEHYTEAMYLLIAIVVYIVGQANSIWIGEFFFGRTHAAAGRPSIKMSPLKLPIAVCLALAVFPWCLLGSMKVKQVTWRGITYTIEGPFKIRRENYEPFRAAAANTNQSL